MAIFRPFRKWQKIRSHWYAGGYAGSQTIAIKPGVVWFRCVGFERGHIGLKRKVAA